MAAMVLGLLASQGSSRGRRMAVLVLSILVLAGLAGCAGPSRPQVASVATSAPAPEVGEPVRPPSIVTVDPAVNVTGTAHVHDWWGDDTTRSILDRDLAPGPAGVCVGAGDDMSACQNGPKETRHVRFETPADHIGAPNNVWPGTGRLVLDLSLDGEILHPFDVGIQIPRGGTWDENVYAVDGRVTSIVVDDIQENQTDPPHFRGSGWSFRILPRATAAGVPASLYQGTMHWTITIHRSDRPLPLDPAHPDHWAGSPSRNLLDEAMRLDARQVEVGPQFVNSATRSPFGPPANQTVLPGTERMTVRLEWANELPHPTQLVLKTCDAAAECGQNDGWTFHTAAQTGANWSHYEIEVRPDQWDFVYQTTSRWKFHFEFENGDLSPAVGRSGLFRGTVRVVADIHHGGSASL